MKTIIEQIVKQEISRIVVENENTIAQSVKALLLPELRSAVRDAIPVILKDLLKEFPAGGGDTRQIGDPFPDSDSMQGSYLYCIVEGGEGVTFGKIGIEKNEVYTICHNDLCAVLHQSPAAPYHSDDEKMAAEWVLVHQKVIDTAWERFDIVVPFGFDTIILGDAIATPEENLRNWIKENYENLKEKMEKVRGRAEFGVQIFWDSKAAVQQLGEENAEIRKLNEEIKSQPKGLAYMYRQKLENLLHKETEKLADQYFRKFYAGIKAHTDDLRIEKASQTKEKNKQMLMNLSCLLPKNGHEKLGQELEKIDAMEVFSVRYTGPWPPYSFV